ncbi:MAG: 3' terminal RNA ribose 2'-O-methyltransferase Hen1, partial [Victivallales bacterium]|nr:3' terminal RNA ribose 2'-O-methyltransferase Hen1 [Victivallales bacterium]
MLLTITSTHSPAPDLGYLLHKHPARCQEFELSFGSVYVFFPEATEARCTAALLLDVDPVGMVKGKRRRSGPRDLFQYVNDRPYVGSSFLSVAIAQVFGSALNGTCKTRPELLVQPQELVATISALPCRRGGEDFLRRLFEPLGYEVTTTRQPLDEEFPEWGESPYFTVTLRGTVTLAQLLTHIYVLVPVLDNNKHYFISSDEVDKLLAKGEGWLADHPECKHITRRFLGFRPSLARQAFARLAEEASDEEEEEVATPAEDDRVSLNDARLGAVTAAIRNSGAKRVLDLGCGEGRLLRELLKMREIEKLVGMDV